MGEHCLTALFKHLPKLLQAGLEAGGAISKAQTLALVSANLERLLGFDAGASGHPDLVVTQGGNLLDIESKVVGVISAIRGGVDVF